MRHKAVAMQQKVIPNCYAYLRNGRSDDFAGGNKKEIPDEGIRTRQCLSHFSIYRHAALL
jgi:hypothetical protein